MSESLLCLIGGLGFAGLIYRLPQILSVLTLTPKLEPTGVFALPKSPIDVPPPPPRMALPPPRVEPPPRNELEQYLDRRMEELLEPEHWERANLGHVDSTSGGGLNRAEVLLCGLTIVVSADRGVDPKVYYSLPECGTQPNLRSDIKTRFLRNFQQTWPELELYLGDRNTRLIAKLEAARKTAGCPGHEQPSPMESK